MRSIALFAGAIATAALTSASALAQGQFAIAPADVFTSTGKASSYNGPSTGGADLRGAVEDGGVDAYDLAGLLFFSGLPFQGAPSGISIHRRTDTLSNINVYRWLVTFTNESTSTITVPVASFTGVGADGLGVIAAKDPFRCVAFENMDPADPTRPTDPVLGMMHGNNAWASSHIDFNTDLNVSSRTFSLALGAGESVTLMFADFLALSVDANGNPSGQASDVQLALDRTASYIADPTPLLEGLDGATIASLANWSLVSVPTPGAASALGLAGLVALRRRRAAR